MCCWFACILVLQPINSRDALMSSFLLSVLVNTRPKVIRLFCRFCAWRRCTSQVSPSYLRYLKQYPKIPPFLSRFASEVRKSSIGNRTEMPRCGLVFEGRVLNLEPEKGSPKGEFSQNGSHVLRSWTPGLDLCFWERHFRG